MDLLLWAPLLHTASLCVAGLPRADGGGEDGTAEVGSAGDGLAPHSLSGVADFADQRSCGTGLRPFFRFMDSSFAEDPACVRQRLEFAGTGKWPLPRFFSGWEVNHVVASARLRIAPPVLHHYGGGGGGGGGGDAPPRLLVITTPGLRLDDDTDGGGGRDADEFCPRKWATCLTPGAIRAVALAATQSGGRWRILLWPTVLPE